MILMNEINVTTNKSGDWTTIYLNGDVYAEGHPISVKTWLELIFELGNKVHYKKVPDDDM